MVLARLRVVFGADVGPGRDALGGLGLGLLAVWFTFVGVLRGGDWVFYVWVLVISWL